MADALAILGLVSNIVTFVEFGSKVVSGAKQIRDSGKGTPQELSELEKIVEDVRRSNSEATNHLSNGCTSPDARRITAMVEDCEKICKQLRVLIKKLATRDESILESGRVAFQALWRKKDIQDLRDRLNALDERIRHNIQFAFQETRHDSVLSQLRAIEMRQQVEGIAQSSKLDSVRDEIMRLTSQNEHSREKQLETQTAVLISLITKLDFLRNEHLVALEQLETLKSLYFPEFRRRHDQIPIAEHRTNKWIHDPNKTAFAAWLGSSQQDDGLFYIFGKAGSGKSTLMKYISESQSTQDHLKHWTGSHRLFTSSFYFWNQGSEMQKSELGLFQSLLYQVIRADPQLAPLVSSNRLKHEAWDMKSLKATFELITRDSRHTTKYFFLIDGLDEYEGDEWDVVGMLKALSSSGHIKICASSRPGRVYERFVHDKILNKGNRMLDIADFTRSDMELYVHTRLHNSDKFLEIAYPKQGQRMHTTCQQIISNITDWARGVWLWVFLVTRDIVKQVERDESVAQLRRVVDDFPADLEKYFERIIERIDDRHKDEMAQIFLVTMDELQPLPLYAFDLLERERENEHYAIQEATRPLDEREFSCSYEQWKSRVRNRCGDLLIVDNQPHPVFLSHSVDFLHRTVRDFLRDCYQDRLRDHLKRNFDPSVSLCKIYLCFLKGFPYGEARDAGDARNTVIRMTDELLYYAHEVEKRSDKDLDTPLEAVLDELDRVNCQFNMTKSNHWTHARDLPKQQGWDYYAEGGQCNFLALTVQVRLVKYVRTKLQTNPKHLQKGGRPLLDYALRPLRVTPISMPYHSGRDDSHVDVDMVELFLEHGASPSQKVHLNDGESVWGLFLISMYSSREHVGQSLRKAWFNSCLALIRAGARSDYSFIHQDFTQSKVVDVITAVFRPEEVATLQTTMEVCMEMQKSQSASCRVM